MKTYVDELKTSKNKSLNKKKMWTGFDASTDKKKTKTDGKKTAEAVTTSSANSDAAAVERGELEKNELKSG